MYENDGEYEIDLLQIWEIIKKRIVLLAVIIMLSVLTAFLITKFVMKEEFTATAKLIVVQKSNSTSQDYTYSDLQLSQKLTSTYSEIIMSEAISEPVINNLNLLEEYNIDSKAYGNIVKVSAANNTEVIDVKVTTNSPKLSADIANEVVKVFEDRIYDIMQIENVTTLTDAKVPTKKSGPSTIKNMAIGAVIGAFICAIVVFISLFTDTKVKTEDEVKKIFDYPIIGSVPNFDVEDDGGDFEDDDIE